MEFLEIQKFCLTTVPFHKISLIMSTLEQYFAQLGASSFILVSDDARSSFSLRKGQCRGCLDTCDGLTTASPFGENPVPDLPDQESITDKGPSRWDASPSPSSVLLENHVSPRRQDSILAIPKRRKFQHDVIERHISELRREESAEEIDSVSHRAPFENEARGKKKSLPIFCHTMLADPAAGSSSNDDKSTSSSSSTATPGTFRYHLAPRC